MNFLSRIFKDMARYEDGMLADAKKRYTYVLVKDDAHKERLIQKMFKWRKTDKDDSFVRKLAGDKVDDLGRRMVVQHGRSSVWCPDLEMHSKNYAVVKGKVHIPQSFCKHCLHRVRSRIRRTSYSCQLLRIQRKGSSKKLWDDANKKAAEMMGRNDGWNY